MYDGRVQVCVMECVMEGGVCDGVCDGGGWGCMCV